jgi:hypothetical protein
LSRLLKIGTMVALKPYNQMYQRPIGIVVGHLESTFNIVDWVNDNHNQDNGGYLNSSLEILSGVKYGS